MANGLSGRIERFRERVQSAKQKREAKKRAKERKQQRKQKRKKAEQRARGRRVEKNEPEGAREEAAASVRQLRLLGSELGVDRETAQNISQQANELIDTAQQEGSMGALDVDGDGDTDILQSFEEELTEEDAFDLSEAGSGFDPTVVEAGETGDASEPVDPTSKEFEEDLLGL